MTQRKLPDPIIKYEDLDDLIKEGVTYQEELKQLLKDVKVPVTAMHPHVLNAIRQIFGNDYITDKGTSYVTFDMVVECMKIVRSTGKATADEFIL